MRRPGGYLVVIGQEKKAEADTFTCCHCQRVVLVKPKAPPAECGGWCGRCAKLICGPCAARPGCDPFERKLERVEARARLLAALTPA